MLTKLSDDYKELLQKVLLVVLSAFFYAISLKVFIEPADLVPAGFIGFSRLVEKILMDFFHIKLGYMSLYFVLQSLMTLLVFKIIGRRFTLMTILWFGLMSLFTMFIPVFYIESDLILMTIFGGVVSGISTLIALRAGASGGGTDFIAVYFLNKGNIPIYDYIMYGNWIVIAIFGYLFGWKLAMYSMVFQYVSTSLVTNMNTQQKLANLYIISAKANEVGKVLLKAQKHGITRIWGDGVYTGKPRGMLFMVVSEYEVAQIVHLVQQVDPDAFINISKAERVVGNFKRKQIT